MKPSAWCRVCRTRHDGFARCPGELPATGPERAGFRVSAETPRGMEAFGVLLAPSWQLWRARILTYPSKLWAIPGGGGPMRFIGHTPLEAEQQAAEFIRAHCRSRGYRIRDEIAPAAPASAIVQGDRLHLPTPQAPPAERKETFVWVRFGLAGPSESGKTGNLSETGLFVITDNPADQGQWLDLWLDVEDDSISMQGEVRWTRHSHQSGRAPGMGIQLEAPPESYLDYVRTID